MATSYVLPESGACLQAGRVQRVKITASRMAVKIKSRVTYFHMQADSLEPDLTNTDFSPKDIATLWLTSIH